MKKEEVVEKTFVTILICLQVQIEYLQELKKAGGKTNFIKQLREKDTVCSYCNSTPYTRSIGCRCSNCFHK